VKVVLSLRASRAADRLAKRWHEHADDPDVFAREFLEVIELLSTTRSPGSPCPTARHPQLKRLLLKKSYCHVYFKLDERRQLITILQLWDGRRGHLPRL
jgi:hypothetical protein